MGCDIHLYTEKKIKWENKPEFWHCCDSFQLNEWHEFDGEPPYYVKSIYDGRNYELFTALADVRHCDGIDVIDKPRGLPKDVSPTVKKESDDWGVDGHSHSWLTAEELFKYQNTHPFTTYSGMIYGEDLEKFKRYGIAPKWWCGWTSMDNAEFHSWQVPGSPVDKLAECVKKKMMEEFWIFDWKSQKEQEDQLWKNASDFRIVFWFDN